MSSMKTLNWITLVIALGALTAAIFILQNSGGPKLAFVVNSEIMQGYVPAMQAQQQKEALQKFHQAKIDSMQSDLNTLQQALQSGGGKMIEDQMRQKGLAFQQYAQQAQRQLNAFEQQKMDSVYQVVNEGVKAFAEKNGYTMIFGTLNGNIVYADSVDNVTEAVIKFLNTR